MNQEEETKFIDFQEIKVESFGQSEPLTNRLSSILRDYPKGTQIFKELLQNADDAKATDFKILFDERTHSNSKLLHPKMESLQGPAICAFNNAKFEHKDFESIRNLAQSKKSNDVTKIGTFGIGFNSVYHITDFPCFASNNFIVIFDPHRQCINRELLIHGDPGIRIDFIENSEIYQKFPDQFEPLNLFGFDGKKKEPFDGTVFRFPLRNKEFAKISKISSSTYSPNDVLDLLKKFSEEAVEDILFLKHVKHVSLYHYPKDGKEPVKLYSVDLNEIDKNDIINRKKINEFLKNPIEQNEEQYHYKVNIKEDYLDKIVEQKWVINCCIGGENLKKIAKDGLEKKLSLRMIPFGSVAACITQEIKGRVFCFLPLPSETGLPVHINSFFEMFSNRRELWKGSHSMDSDSLIKAKWNIALMENLLGPTYGNLLKIIQEEKLLENEKLYSLFPNYQSIGSDWKNLIHSFYRSLTTQNVPCLLNTKKKWNSPSECLIPQDTLDSDLKHVLEKFLSEKYDVISKLPLFIENGFTVSDVPLKVISPSLVRETLKFLKGNFDKDDLFLILSYITKDKKYSELIGVPGVLMTNGAIEPFGSNNDSKLFLVSNQEYQLFSKKSSKTIDAIDGEKLRMIYQDKELQKHTNIDILRAKELNHYLDEVFPKKWKELKEVEWDQTQYPEDYMIESWKYFSKIEIEFISKWPVVPCSFKGKNTLNPISGLMNTSILKDEENVVAVEVKEVLNFIGFRFIHPNFFNIQAPKLSLINILSSPICKHLLNHSFSKKQKEELVDFFSNEWSSKKLIFNDQQKKILINLNIYETFDDTYEDLSDKHIPSFDIDPRFLSGMRNFIKIKTTQLTFFENLLNSSIVDKKSIYMKYIFPSVKKKSISNDILDEIMIDAIQESSKYQEFKIILKELPFILVNEKGTRLPPSKVYNPSNPDLKLFFKDQDVFPIKAYLQEEILASLSLIGMNSSISPHLFKSLVQDITYENALNLLNYFNQNDKIFETNTKEWKQAFDSCASLRWIPIETRPIPNEFSILKIPKNKLETPSNSTLKKNANIIGSRKYICSLNITSKLLIEYLNWKDKSLEFCQHLVQQLIIFSKNYKPDIKEDVRDFLSDSTYKIYEKLDNYIQENPNFDLSRHFTENALIWMGTKFVDLTMVSLSSKLNLKPILFELPSSYLKFKSLLTSLKVQEKFSNFKLINVMKNIPKYDITKEEGINISLSIIQEIINEPNIKKADIFLPSNDGNFLLAKDLMYVDSKELELTKYDSQKTILHKGIARDTAITLGVLPLTSFLEERNSSLLTINDDYSGETFGQHEPLTSRIANILKDYPSSDNTIFIELLQNAEDAKATEFSIIFDKTDYEKDKLFNKELGELQGPSIFIYNNSIFSEKDIQSIQQLGVAHKIHDLTKVGRFGIGFNSVYHLSDAPSFISDTSFIIMDPHCKYVKGSSPIHPGRRYKFTSPGMLETFYDQLKPYLIFDNDGRNPFQGSLFRLPLRTKEQSKMSLVSNEHWNESKTMKLIENFISQAKNCMLFLKNVEKITVSIKNKDEIETLLEITSKKSKNIIDMQEEVKNISKSLSNYELKKVDEDKNLSKAERKKKKMMENLMSEKVNNYPEKKQDVGSIEFVIKNHQKIEKEKWFVSMYLGGTNEIWELCVKNMNEDNKYRLLPYSSVAVCLDQDVQGISYSTLPLPVETGLKVHMNSYFEMSSNRREIWQSKLDVNEDYRGKWNKLLLTHNIPISLIQLILFLKDYHLKSTNVEENEKIFNKIMDLLPLSSKIGKSIIHNIIEPFYTLLLKESLFFSKSSPTLLNISKGIFADPKEKILSNTEIYKFLVQDKFPLVIISKELIQQLSEYYKNITIINTENIQNFYSKYFSKNEPTKEKIQLIWKFLSEEKAKFLSSAFENFPVLNCSLKVIHFNSKEKKNRFKKDLELILLNDPSILKFMPNSVIDSIIDLDIAKHIQSVIRGDLSSLGVNLLSPEAFERILYDKYPKLKRGGIIKNSTPYDEVVNNIWNFIEKDNNYKQVFNEWSIVPTTQGLYPLESSKKVIRKYIPQSLRSQDNDWSQVFNLIEQLNAPFLLNEYEKISSIRESTSILSDSVALDFISSNKSFLKFSKKEKLTFLNFFTINRLSDQDKRKFISLAIFENTIGLFTSIQQVNYVIYTSKIPKFETSMNIIEYQSKYDELYSLAGVKVLRNDMEIYEFLILPQLKNLSSQEKMAHLNYIINSNIKDSMARFLSNIPFLNGKKPTECYDPQVTLFNILFDKSHFPQSPFNSKIWLEYLRKCGLKTEITEEVILNGITLISKNNLEPEKVEVIFESLITKNNYSKEFFEKIETLPLFPKEDISFPMAKEDSELVPLTSCVYQKYTNVCWTTMNILPKKYERIANIITANTSYKMKPKFLDVMIHLNNLSTIQSNELDIKGITKEIYSFLQQHITYNTGLNRFKDPKIIYINGFFVKPKYVFWKLNESLPPYLQKCPEEYLEFKGLFSSWGCSDLPSEDFCKSILKQFYSAQKEKKVKLTNNSIDLCTKFIKLLSIDLGCSLKGSFLLTSKLKLSPFRMVVVNDAPYLEKKIKFDELKIINKNIEDIAEKLEVTRLSSIVQEKLEVNKDVEIEITKELKDLNQKIKSNEFLNGLVRVMKHEMRNEVENKNNLLLIQKKLEGLKNIEMVQVSNLVSSFIDLRTHKNITLDSKGSLCFIDSSNNRLYLSKNVPSMIDPCLLISKEINKYLGYPFKDISLIPLILKCEINEIPKILDQFSVSNFIGDDVNMNRTIGSVVFKEDAELFKKSNTKSVLHPGELIAYLKDEKLYYGRVKEKVKQKYEILVKEKESVQMKLEEIYQLKNEFDDQEIKVEKKEEKNSLDPLMNSLQCPITKDIFVNPVIASDGFTYERDAIKQWMEYNNTSPLTRKEFTNKTLIPNNLLKSIIAQYVDGK